MSRAADIMSQALGYGDYGQYYIIFQAYMKKSLRYQLLTNEFLCSGR